MSNEVCNVYNHEAARQDTRLVLHWIRVLARKQERGENVYIINRVFAAVPPFLIGLDSFPGWAAVFTIFFPDNTVEDRRVFFVQGNPWVLEAAKRGRRTSTLILRSRPERKTDS